MCALMVKLIIVLKKQDLIHYKQYDLHGHQIPGFEYERPKLDEDLIMEVLKYYLKLNLFPKSVLIN